MQGDPLDELSTLSRRGRGGATYLPAARRCQRVAFSIFLCFFLRMRLRRFLISEPMRGPNLVAERWRRQMSDTAR